VKETNGLLVRGTNMKTLKAQASMEMLITVGMMLAFVVPISLLLLTTSGQNFEEVSKHQAQVTVQKIAHAVNTVYLEGEGSSKNVLLNIPSNTKSLEIRSSEVLLILGTAQGEYEVTYPLIPEDGNVVVITEDELIHLRGLSWISVKNVGENMVEVDESS